MLASKQCVAQRSFDRSYIVIDQIKSEKKRVLLKTISSIFRISKNETNLSNFEPSALPKKDVGDGDSNILEQNLSMSSCKIPYKSSLYIFLPFFMKY